jgi:hypothetical protein
VAYQTLAVLCTAAGRWRDGSDTTASGSSSPSSREAHSEEAQLAARAQELLRGSLSKPLEDYHRAVTAAAAAGDSSAASSSKGGGLIKRSRNAEAEHKVSAVVFAVAPITLNC